MKVAIVHEWLVNYSGSERVLEQILEVYPNADLYAIVEFLGKVERKFIKNKLVKTSFIQRLPFARNFFRYYLPLMMIAVEQFDLSDYDLIISSSHAVAKGVITGPNQLHVCMCYTPPRYAWDLQHQYLGESNIKGGLRGLLVRYFLHKMRMWDLRTANGVDEFISISKFISKRIEKVYRRKSAIIYPPVDVLSFKFQKDKKQFYLTASRLVPYKRVELIVRTFNEMPDKNLVVIGDGPEYNKIKKMAGPNVAILGYQKHEVLCSYLSNAKAFVFAAEEDFGIVVLEAQASGTPVIAFGRGGALETVQGLGSKFPTGVFFFEQNTKSIRAAVQEFESSDGIIESINCLKNANKFSKDVFIKSFSDYIELKLNIFRNL